MVKIKNWKNRRGMYYFYCPACKENHQIALSENDCGFPIWNWNNNADNPTISPSIKVEYRGADKNTVCHSFVREGKIQFLSDCTHELAGKTIPLDDL